MIITRILLSPEVIRAKLRRQPFGKSGDNFTWPAPPPIPPKDYYHKKPAFWRIRGTIAYTYQSSICIGLSLVALAVSVAIMVWKPDRPREFLRLITGRQPNQQDEQEARWIGRKIAIFGMDRLPNLDVKTPTTAGEQREIWKTKSGQSTHGESEQTHAFSLNLHDPDKSSRM